MEANLVATEEFIELVREEFERLDTGGKLLLTVGCRHVLKINMILLQFLLDEKNLNGLYICVDIPQINVDRLLKKYNISREGLKYIDTITGLSSLERQFNENIFYIDNPFNVRIINDAINRVQSDGVKRFVILDNMATLQFYSSEIGHFFENFIGSIDEHNISYLMLAVDKIKHSKTYDIIRPFCDSELEIMPDWIERIVD
jgi:hypothetical protein